MVNYTILDPTEKIAKYKFDIFDENNMLIETSEW
jgi:hypothetical protein